MTNTTAPVSVQEILAPLIALNNASLKYLIMIAVLAGTLYLTYRSYRALASPYPGPFLAKLTSLWLMHSEWQGQRTATIQKLHARYGSVVQIGPNAFSFTSAQALRDIFSGKSKLNRPVGDTEFLEQFGHANLASTDDGNLHLRRRRAVAAVYTTPVVISKESHELYNGLVDKLIANLDNEQEKNGLVDVFPQLRYLASDLMGHIVYGKNFNLDLLGDRPGHRDMMSDLLSSRLTEKELVTTGALLGACYPNANRWLQNLAPKWFNLDTPMHKWAMESTLNIVSSKSTEGPLVSHTQHLKTHIISQGSTEAVPGLKYIASDGLDHFSAGSLTTPNVLSWLLYHLSKPANHDQQERLRKELHDAGCLQDEHAELWDLNKLPYLECVLRETLRLHPPIPMSLSRVAPPGGITVDGYFVGEGTIISAQPASVHRVPEIFPNAENWNPERWDIPRKSEEFRVMHRHFWPFGSGPRMCIGMHVAWAEMRFVVARIYTTYETRLGPEYFDADPDAKEILREILEDDDDDVFPGGPYEPIVFKRL